MNHKVAMLEVEVNKRTRELEQAKNELEHIRRTCRHQWGPTQYAPLREGGYEIPGDPVGTMGVDWRGPTWVPRTERPRWKRTCEECGKVEETERTEDKVEKTPVFDRGW